jgi:hypothetical protein
MAIDWKNLFEESHPLAGAGPEELERLINTVSEPLTTDEIRQINSRSKTQFSLLTRCTRFTCHSTQLIGDFPTGHFPRPALRFSSGRMAVGSKSERYHPEECRFRFRPGIRAVASSAGLPVREELKDPCSGPLPAWL